MAISLPPVPINEPPDSFAWQQWYLELQRLLGGTQGTVAWSLIDFTGSDLSDLADRDHADLQNMQGGAVGERYHLTSNQQLAVAGIVSGSSADHGLLSGLTDDDHTQYLLAAGTRGLSADWDAGSFEIRAQTLEADVATGTAPLTIASTTVVTNLNADLLDGEHASAFADAVHTHVTTDITDITASAAELNTMDGITATVTELNYTDGVTSAIQTQLDGKQPLDAGLTDVAGLAVTDGNIIVGNGTNWVAESGATARTSLGLGTGDSPQFTAVNIGHASDTTLARSAAGTLTVEGNVIYRAGGTDVPVTDGGTGASTAAGALVNLGLTATAAELNTLDGITATVAELNVLDGITSTVTELNYTDGVTSAIQTQLDAKQPLDADLTTLSTAFTTASASTAASLALHEDTDNGTNKVTLIAPASIASDKTITFQDVTGTVYVTGGTDVAVADGGTGASTAASALTNLGLTATAAELNTLDGITSTVTELNYTDGVTSAIQTQLNGKQPLDAQLTDVAGLAVTDGNFIVGNGTNFVAESGATARTSLGLGTIATQNSNNVSITGGSVTGITDLAVADGGTGASTAAGALTNLGLTATAAELNTLDGITSTVTELNYTDGVTSAIQTQLDGKYTVGGTDVSVADGGTGRSSHTEYAVLCGGTTTTGAQQSIAGVGTAGQVLTSNGAGALPTFQDVGAASSNGTLGTPIATTSGTSADFTSLPATMKKITMMLNGVSTDGSEELIVRLGDSGGFKTTGYISSAGRITSSAATVADNSTGFLIDSGGAAAAVLSGEITLTLMNTSTNTWTASGCFNRGTATTFCAGSVSLSGTMDRIQLTTTGTPDDFDAGEVNIWYN